MLGRRHVRGEVLSSFQLACRASRNNFLAEIAALLAAMPAVPSNVDTRYALNRCSLSAL